MKLPLEYSYPFAENAKFFGIPILSTEESTALSTPANTGT
jgi:hypothetical protein